MKYLHLPRVTCVLSDCWRIFFNASFLQKLKNQRVKNKFSNLYEAPFTHVLVSALLFFLSFWRNIIFMFALFSFPGRQFIPFLLLLTFSLLPILLPLGIFRLTGLHGYFQILFAHFLFPLCTEDLILSKNSVSFSPFYPILSFFSIIFFSKAQYINFLISRSDASSIFGKSSQCRAKNSALFPFFYSNSSLEPFFSI